MARVYGSDFRSRANGSACRVARITHPETVSKGAVSLFHGVNWSRSMVVTFSSLTAAPKRTSATLTSPTIKN